MASRFVSVLKDKILKIKEEEALFEYKEATKFDVLVFDYTVSSYSFYSLFFYF